jgi:proteasome lid subunit RPN8/RPN11
MSIVDVDCTTLAHERIRDLATLAYPDEGCGVLIGRAHDRRVAIDHATAGRNLNSARSQDRYELDPHDILQADRDARARGLDIVGFWHSHPDHPAHPSQFDTDRAWLDYVYVICRTTREGAEDVNAFVLTAEGGPFEQVRLVVKPPAPTRAR